MQELYSLENARKFSWSSVSGDLHVERVAHLENYIVGSKILDAGCGGGAFVEFLCLKGLEVTGVDKYDEFLQVARQQGRSGTYLQGDLTNLPFSDKVFDCTYCFDVLEHVDDEVAIRELARVTKNRIIIAVPKEDDVMNKFSLTFAHYQDKTHLRNYTEDSLRNLCLKANPSKVTIFSELKFQAKSLILDLVSLDYSTMFIKKVYRKLYLKLFNFLLDRATIKEIPTGLVAIVDL